MNDMKTFQKKKSTLIVDPDRQFLESLQADVKAAYFPPLLAKTGKQAQLAMSDPEQPLFGLFINPKISSAHGLGFLSVIRFAHQRRPSMPIYLIYEESLPINAEEMSGLGIQEALAKPISYSKIVSLVTPAAISLDLDAVAKQSESNKDQVGVEATGTDSEFVPIRSADFISGTTSFFDLYVRLDSGRYVKLLQSGECFTPDRLEGYLNKGVAHFYLRKEAQQHYLNYCNQLASSLVKNQKAPLDLQTAQVLNHGEETMKFLRSQGLSETNLQYAMGFSENLQRLVGKLELEKVDFLSDFMSDLASYEHGVSTSIIASLLCNPLDIQSDSIVKTVGLAALLHDVGLSKMPAELHCEDESKMTEEQKTLYHTHPLVGAEMLGTIRSMPQQMLHAIAYHHERKDRKGFSARTGAKTANRFSEIVGISCAFMRVIERESQAKSAPSLQRVMEQSVFDGYSTVVVEVFKSIFFPK